MAGDTNQAPDIFVHDRETGQTTRVSVASNGTKANRPSWTPAISADGRFVAFGSDADNLVPGDTNMTDSSWGSDIFVHDRQTGETTRVSVASDGTQAEGWSYWPWVDYDDGDSGITIATGSYSPAISADGRFVAFRSFATNLVANDTNQTADIFMHDRQTGETTRVSVASDGTQASDYSGYPSGTPDTAPAISADGRFVTFVSNATNLVAGDTNGQPDVFVHDRQTGETTRVSVASDGAEGNYIAGWGVDKAPISTDGRFVAFVSDATNLLPLEKCRYALYRSRVFVRDRGAIAD